MGSLWFILVLAAILAQARHHQIHTGSQQPGGPGAREPGASGAEEPGAWRLWKLLSANSRAAPVLKSLAPLVLKSLEPGRSCEV